MTRNALSKFFLAGVLAIFTVLTVAPQPAEAGPVRVRFTPPFGAPFPDLDWGGVVDIDDGGCTALGSVSNIAGGCSGSFSFISGTLTLTSLASMASGPLVTTSLTLDPFSSIITSVDRTNFDPDGFNGASATPFAAVQAPADFLPALYDGQPAWFSLVLLGGTDIRLYWFENQPGNFLSTPFVYQQCGRGSLVEVGDFGRCGISDAVNFPAVVQVTAVPEPSTYAMMLAGLGMLGYAARRRRAARA